MALPAVGCRVRILKDYATVRYIGPVAQQQGIWVGVEWDDHSRGKHDGSTAGVRYFNCVSGTTSGSFVRIERVCFGITLLEALRARYNNETAEHGEDVAAEELYVHTSRRRRVKVQLVGEEKIQQKQRQIHMLQSARLVGLDVSAVGDPAQLRDSIPSITSLDLTCNLVAGWDFVEHLAGREQGALTQLAVLNLSENKLTVPPASPSRSLTLLPSLRVLVLNDCGVAWQDVISVAPALPSLEELHLCGNPIGHLQPPPPPSPPPPPAAGQRQHQRPAHTAQLQGPSEVQTREGRQEAGGAGHVDGSGTSPGGSREGDADCGSSGVGGSNAATAPVAAVEAEGEGASGLDGAGEEEAAAMLASLFPHLQVLTLEDCQLPGWSAVEVLRRLPALTRLHLAGNTRLTHITYPGEEGAAAASPAAEQDQAAGVAAAPAAAVREAGPAAFPRLSSLLLGGCGISQWGSVDQLDRFPELREVRLTGNPVLTSSRGGGRFEVIGRVSKLTQLNGAEVRPRERRDAELRYLQHIATEMDRAGADESQRAAVRAAHPRLRRLIELHGAVLATAARDSGAGGSLASSMVEIKLTCVAAGATAKMGTQVKKLPKSTTVSALRLLCERLFKVKSQEMALFLRAPGDPMPEDIGAEDLQDRTLGFFGAQDGYEVLIDEVDPEALRRADEDARAAATAAHEGRLAEQLRAAEKLQAEFARSMGLQAQQQQQQQQQQQP
ncbi:hypothetical protein Vretimale_16995 [Volvox reticuliferus]|uniref:Uncharacterized protein n=1 Tax=Volvox reticuliferus TaxID=1737510 RepID=A0A8J4GUV1_9CHLO|nr:hypothetical protein Vretifemale_7882 [Volvox reticuliferus]GIM13980.1 hypothetical protein Vretimale_16995 [Volvox reticuliferus]